jgi:TRAP-type transport system periplasmic protein
MNKVKITSLFLYCILFGVFAINITEAKPKASLDVKTVELKFSTGFPANHTMQVRAFEPWAKKIRELTKNKVVIKFFPAGVLGKTLEQFNLAEKGITDITYTLHDYTPGRFPMTEVFELPFMTPSAERASIAMWKIYEKFPDFKKEYKSVKLLALFCHPGGDFHTRTRPITKISDFKGLKLRTASPFVTSALNIFGATPVSLPINETYAALESGKVDGTVAPWEGLGIFKLDDITKFATNADFYTMTMMVVMNKNKFDSLPNDVKKIINENSGLVLSTECGKLYDATDEPFREQALKKGIIEYNLDPKEKRKLEALTLPLRVRWVKDMNSKGLPGKEVLKEVLEIIGKK